MKGWLREKSIKLGLKVKWDMKWERKAGIKRIKKIQEVKHKRQGKMRKREFARQKMNERHAKRDAKEKEEFGLLEGMNCWIFWIESAASLIHLSDMGCAVWCGWVLATLPVALSSPSISPIALYPSPCLYRPSLWYGLGFDVVVCWRFSRMVSITIKDSLPGLEKALESCT